MKTAQDVTRRRFISSAAVGGGCALLWSAASGLYTTAMPLYRPLSTDNDPTVIRTAFLADPSARWPYMNVQVEAEREPLNNQLDRLERMMNTSSKSWPYNIRFMGREIVRSEEDTARFIRSCADADGIVLIEMSSKIRPYVDKIINLGQPTVLYQSPPTGHTWLGTLQKGRQGAPVDVLSSSSLADLEPFVRIFDTNHRLKRTKILHLANRKVQEQYADAVERKFGVEIKRMNFDALNSLYESIDRKEAERAADVFINNAVKTVEPTREEIIRCNAMYLAAQKLLEEENSNAITIDCFPGLLNETLVAHPCVAFSRLNDDGLLGVCQADMPSTITSLIMQYFTGGKPGVVTNDFFDTHRNLVGHSHCVSATKMSGLAGDPEPYIIRSHQETSAGTAVKVLMQPGQVITTMKLNEPDVLVLSTQRIVENDDINRGCRTQFYCKLIDPETGEEMDVDYFMHNFTPGILGVHRVSFYGNYAADMKKLGRLMGVKVIEEAKPV